MKKSANSKRGKRARAAGARFERKVRADMESQGWIIDKWTNNVDLEAGKLTPAKRKFNPYKKIMLMSSGFPDFIAFRRKGNNHQVIGVEVKGDGWLDKTEKEKCKWLLSQKIFSKILIAKKGKKRGQIEYVDFKTKHGLQ